MGSVYETSREEFLLMLSVQNELFYCCWTENCKSNQSNTKE